MHNNLSSLLSQYFSSEYISPLLNDFKKDIKISIELISAVLLHTLSHHSCKIRSCFKYQEEEELIKQINQFLTVLSEIVDPSSQPVDISSRNMTLSTPISSKRQSKIVNYVSSIGQDDDRCFLFFIF